MVHLGMEKTAAVTDDPDTGVGPRSAQTCQKALDVRCLGPVIVRPDQDTNETVRLRGGCQNGQHRPKTVRVEVPGLPAQL